MSFVIVVLIEFSLWNRLVKFLRDLHFAVFAMEGVASEGQNAAVMRIAWVDFVHHSGVCMSGHMMHQSSVMVMMIHQMSMMSDMFVMVQQWSVIGLSMMQIMCMQMFIMMIVLVYDMMINRRFYVVQEMVRLMMHHFGDMMHRLDMVDWLVVHNFGSGCGMVYVMVDIMMHIVMKMRVMHDRMHIDMCAVIIMMIDRMRFDVFRSAVGIDYDGRWVAEMDAAAMWYVNMVGTFHDVRVVAVVW